MRSEQPLADASAFDRSRFPERGPYGSDLQFLEREPREAERAADDAAGVARQTAVIVRF